MRNSGTSQPPKKLSALNRAILIPIIDETKDDCPVVRPSPSPEFGTEVQNVLTLMRIFGFFPGYFHFFPSNSSSRFSKALKKSWWKVFSLAYIGVCTALIYLNYHVIKIMFLYMGPLHVRTLTALLTGFKPLQGFLNLLTFSLRFKGHITFLKLLR